MTTARLIWEYALTELSKVNAPSLLLHEFNYYINKAIYQYINKRYNIYDVNLLTTDDLRVLKATSILSATKEQPTHFNNLTTTNILTKDDLDNMFNHHATYEVILPDDYLHMLNCICVYKLSLAAENCYDEGDILLVKATRLTADAWSAIINDYYNRPTPWNPYYYIHNVNKLDELPTNIVEGGFVSEIQTLGLEDMNPSVGGNPQSPSEAELRDIEPGTDLTINNRFPDLKVEDNGTLSVDNVNKLSNTNLRKNPAYTRHANASKVRCEIRYGLDDSIYKLAGVLVDYIKAPQRIRLTKLLVDLTADTSLIMEFPDYVCQEIINELVVLLMARTSDPRLQTLIGVTQTIANPLQVAPQQTLNSN